MWGGSDEARAGDRAGVDRDFAGSSCIRASPWGYALDTHSAQLRACADLWLRIAARTAHESFAAALAGTRLARAIRDCARGCISAGGAHGAPADSGGARCELRGCAS